jgi:hypothetical protein
MAEGLPSSVSTFTVVGRLVKGVGDTADVGQDIDLAPISGITVTFTPSLTPPIYAVPSATPNPVTIYQLPIVATTDADGFLKMGADAGLGVELVYGFDPSIVPSGWTWDVTIDVGGNFPPQTFAISGSDGGIVDLSTVIPVPTDPGEDLAEWQAVIVEMEGIRQDIYDAIDDAATSGGGFETWSQTTPAATWTIIHSLPFPPAVTIVDSAGTRIETQIVYDSATQIRSIASVPFSGSAYLS